MKVMPDNQDMTVYFDVDGTLIDVIYGVGEAIEDDELILEHYGKVRILPKYETIEQLKACKGLGYTVVVWHTGGTNWPKKIIKALKLEKYVDLIVAKPSVYFDDQSPEYILGAKGQVEE